MRVGELRAWSVKVEADSTHNIFPILALKMGVATNATQKYYITDYTNKQTAQHRQRATHNSLAQSEYG